MKELPAGLENSIEIYRTAKGLVRALLNGNRMDYLELPCIIREPFQAELIADKSALNCLMYDFKISDTNLLEEKFVGCRYGALDTNPDLKDKQTQSEYPVCDCIKNCPGFDIVCKVPAAPGGKLTKQEFLIVCLIAKGKLDKEIALSLGIEVSTVKTHLSRIREKLCVNNRIEIAFWALNKGI